MTVQDTTPQVQVVANGVDTSFPFTFRADDVSWVSVDFLTNFDQIVLNGDQDNNPGGVANYTVAPPAATTITISRDTPNTQELDYTRYDPFDSESHEDALDKLTMQIQDLEFLINNTLTQDLGSLSDVDLTGLVDGDLLRWNAGTSMWTPTLGLLTFDGNFTVGVPAIMNGLMSVNNTLNMFTGNPITFRSPSNTRVASIAALDETNLTLDGSGGPGFAGFAMVGFTDVRPTWNGTALALLTDVPTVITDHTLLSNIGVNTHAQIDTHLADASIHFTEASIDHLNILNAGVNSHGAIDTHIANALIHFQQSDISHLNIQDIGTNSHAAIDAFIVTATADQVVTAAHIADTSIHFADAPADAQDYVRNNNAWVVASPGGVTDHGALTGLGDDDHTQYLLVDGTRAMSGALDMGTNAITNVGNVDGRDVSADGATLDAHVADATIHFTEASIDHLNIANIGTNSHAAIDAHIADATIHFTVASIDHGSIAGLADDDHTQYVLLAGRAGGQSVFGSNIATQDLTLTANSVNNTGDIVLGSGVSVTFDPTGSGQTHYFNVTPTYSGAAGLNGGFNYSPNITVTSAVSIIEAIRGIPTITQEAATAFSAFTLFQALPIVRTVNASFNPMQAIILNAGPTNEVSGAITPPANPNLTGVGFSPQVRALTSGGTSRVTLTQGLTVTPNFSTVAGSTARYDTIVGLQVNNSQAALFQPIAGTELIDSIYGVNFQDQTFVTPSIETTVIRSSLSAGATNFFLRNLGGAASDFAGSNVHFNDLFGPHFGNTVAEPDVQLGFAGADFFFMQFNSAGAANGFDDQLRISNPSADRFLFNDATGAAEFNFNCLKMSFGAQTGAAGNQKFPFVSGAETITVAGEYSGMLWTYAANDTIDAALSLYATATWNAGNPTLGTGSLTSNVVLNIGGNPGVASTNRVGLRILSNPSGGSGINAALWLTAGRARFDGPVDINNPQALGGGAAPTFGTIGGTGPAVAAQNEWVEVEVNGNTRFIPVWA